MKPETEARLLKLLDKAEIREVIEAYVHAQDRGDEIATIDVYLPDSWDDHGPLKLAGPAFAKASTDALLENWETSAHLLGQSRIRLAGESAGAETYFYCSLTRSEDDTPMLDQMAGRYIDTFERRDGEWRIKDRRCLLDWVSSRPLGDDFVGCDQFLKGSRDGSDPSYEVLALVRGCSRVSA